MQDLLLKMQQQTLEKLGALCPALMAGLCHVSHLRMLESVAAQAWLVLETTRTQQAASLEDAEQHDTRIHRR